jgi:hypothetical protein
LTCEQIDGAGNNYVSQQGTTPVQNVLQLIVDARMRRAGLCPHWNDAHAENHPTTA